MVRELASISTALALLLLGAAVGRADEQADCRAVIDKAVQARGGKDKLLKYTAATARTKGMFHGFGQALPIKGEFTSQWPNKTKVSLELEAMGQELKFVAVADGKQGWRRINDDVVEMSEEQLAEQKHSSFHGYVSSLAGLLLDKDITLKPLGESKIDGRTVVGIKASKPGHRDISLYFDKETGLLTRSVTKVKDVDRDVEFEQETTYGNYKEFEGVKHATKQLMKRDGEPFLEMEVVELKPAVKLDDAVFSKP